MCVDHNDLYNFQIFIFCSYFACSSFITHGCFFKALHNCILLFAWRQDHCLLTCLVPFHSFYHLLLQDWTAASFFSFGKWNTYKVSPSFLFLIPFVPFFNCDPVTSYLFWRGVHAVCLRTCPARRCFLHVIGRRDFSRWIVSIVKSSKTGFTGVPFHPCYL